jgi:hypothetical protein
LGQSDQDQDLQHSGLQAGLSGGSKGKSGFFVGAGLPAMQTPQCIRQTHLMPSLASQLLQVTVPALAFDFAPHHSSRPVGRCALAFDLDFDLGRPVKPRWPNAGSTERVNRQDAGLAATGQGRPVAAARFVLPE